MVALFLSTTIISCSEAIKLISNMTKIVGLNNQQKIEIMEIIKETVPSCPVIIQKDKNDKSIKKTSN